MKSRSPHFTLLILWALSVSILADEPKPLLKGKEAMGDWANDSPGTRRKLTIADLPEPGGESKANGAKVIPRPENAWPVAPGGFEVKEFARDLKNPRAIVTAPNGDIFVAESSANRIHLLRDADDDGTVELSEIFVSGLNQPFGIAFYPLGPDPKFIYVANTDAVVRFPYHNGQTKAEGDPERILELSSGGRLTGGGHWTRDIVFSMDGTKMYVSVGSKSNVDDTEQELIRARIFEADPDGKNQRTYASGIRNPVGLTIHPLTGDLWTSVNERDGLGDDLVPDYITRVKDGGFYGWPWFYLGGHQDPRHAGKHPELKDTVLVPDVLLQAHSASLDLIFYNASQFPIEYRENAFAAEHGSWNRLRRTGYKVIRIPTKNGESSGEYVDFLTGFVTPEGLVWGRPVGVTVTKEGSLLISDDGGECIWRVTYTGK